MNHTQTHRCASRAQCLMPNAHNHSFRRDNGATTRIWVEVEEGVVRMKYPNMSMRAHVSESCVFFVCVCVLYIKPELLCCVRCCLDYS